MAALVFWRRKSQQNSHGVTPVEASNAGGGRLNACAVAKNWRLSTRSVANLVRLQVYHTERPPYLFAARSPWCSASRGFCQQQLILIFFSHGRCITIRLLITSCLGYGGNSLCWDSYYAGCRVERLLLLNSCQILIYRSVNSFWETWNKSEEVILQFSLV